MVVICEECGKIYHLDPEKLKKRMRKNTTQIKCRICEHVITVTKPAPPQIGRGGAVSGDHKPVGNLPASEKRVAGYKKKGPKERRSDTSSLGLRTKMFLLFLFVPLLLITGAGVFSQTQMLTLSRNIMEEGIDVVRKMAEDTIVNKTRSVSSQCLIFLKNNPDLNKDDFYYDPELFRIAVQKVGRGGYTALIERPAPDSKSTDYAIWCHPDKSYIGRPLFATLKTEHGGHLEAYRKIFNALKMGNGGRSYYQFKDESGSSREGFMVVQPIEQTPYLIITTADMGDFTKPAKNFEAGAAKRTIQARDINIALFAALILLMGLSIFIYGYRLTHNIRLLADIADRISVGELDEMIDIKASDEIGNLAEAITRMQESLRFSIERLKREREERSL